MSSYSFDIGQSNCLVKFEESLHLRGAGPASVAEHLNELHRQVELLGENPAANIPDLFGLAEVIYKIFLLTEPLYSNAKEHFAQIYAPGTCYVKSLEELVEGTFRKMTVLEECISSDLDVRYIEAMELASRSISHLVPFVPDMLIKPLNDLIYYSLGFISGSPFDEWSLRQAIEINTDIIMLLKDNNLNPPEQNAFRRFAKITIKMLDNYKELLDRTKAVQWQPRSFAEIKKIKRLKSLAWSVRLIQKITPYERVFKHDLMIFAQGWRTMLKKIDGLVKLREMGNVSINWNQISLFAEQGRKSVMTSIPKQDHCVKPSEELAVPEFIEDFQEIGKRNLETLILPITRFRQSAGAAHLAEGLPYGSSPWGDSTPKMVRASLSFLARLYNEYYKVRSILDQNVDRIEDMMRKFKNSTALCDLRAPALPLVPLSFAKDRARVLSAYREYLNAISKERGQCYKEIGQILQRHKDLKEYFLTADEMDHYLCTGHLIDLRASDWLDCLQKASERGFSFSRFIEEIKLQLLDIGLDEKATVQELLAILKKIYIISRLCNEKDEKLFREICGNENSTAAPFFTRLAQMLDPQTNCYSVSEGIELELTAILYLVDLAPKFLKMRLTVLSQYNRKVMGVNERALTERAIAINSQVLNVCRTKKLAKSLLAQLQTIERDDLPLLFLESVYDLKS